MCIMLVCMLKGLGKISSLNKMPSIFS
jgi:hypothetical protein